MKLRNWQTGLTVLATMTLAACGGGSGSTASSEAADARARAQAVKPALAIGEIEPSEGTKTGTYIVRMSEDPATAYTGGIAGFPATKAAKGQKIDPDSPTVAKYKDYLASRHDAALASVGDGNKLYSYGYVFNGFAAKVSDAQALKLAQTPGVLSVARDEVRVMDTATTPAFLGLTGPTGFWATKATGENVIIGIVDTGIWPEHPSFSDRTGSNGNGSQDGKLSYQQIPGWHGKCVPGTEFNASNCNQKLIGARFYNAGQGGDAGITEQFPGEFNSPRDYNGHGTHTASTAGGNQGVATTDGAAVFGAINGIAPRARIAAYKALWQQADGTGSGTSSDLVAAIDQAVADGVDVINYSISGSRTNFRDPVEIAFLYAADAGVFVATSAGNSGPATSTVAHPSPWLTTVAAGTHNRDGTGSVTLGNGAVYNGASLANAVGSTPLIDSQAAGLAGADAEKVRLCYAAVDNAGVAVLDPAKVAGKIVVCDRGVIGRVNKSLAVKAAGGVGMVLLNTSPNSINADFHSVPTVHLHHTDRPAVKAYAALSSPTAAIAQAVIVTTAAAPFTAAFSSRGPLLASGSLLKPDLIAPGQDVLAGVAPPGNNGKLFDLYSGTSMSSPHVAGLAALMKQLHPDWSPMAIKSALMTTGGDVLDGANTSATVIFRQGAGHVRPNNAADPGLVFDSGFADWLGFLCGTQLPAAFCTDAGVPVLNPSNFNGASIAMGALAGSQTVTRTVTNVGSSAETYTPVVTGMAGVTAAILPASLTVPKGGKATFTVQFTSTTTAALNAYTGGQLTLTGDKGHSVRLPMVVRPVALAAPAEVNGSYNVTFGYSGPFTATPRGLLPASTQPGSLATNQTKDFSVTVPAGATYARFSLFNANVSQASDLDMEVYRGAMPGGTLVGSSGSGTSDEEVSLLNPTAGVYTVRIIGFAVPVGAANFTLFSWALGTANEGNMTVTAPATATLGGSGTITLGFVGLATGTKFLGSIVYGGATGMPNPTILRVDR